MAITDDQPVSVGNLKRIFAKDSGGGLIDNVYPVGSIYMSVNSANPSTLFGGTWQRIQGRFLFAADSAHAAGSTGGEETHKLTASEIPDHKHSINFYKNCVPSKGVSDSVAIYPAYGYPEGDYKRYPYEEYTSTMQGGDQPHNNMPPYLAVYIWKRTA